MPEKHKKITKSKTKQKEECPPCTQVPRYTLCGTQPMGGNIQSLYLNRCCVANGVHLLINFLLGMRF